MCSRGSHHVCVKFRDTYAASSARGARFGYHFVKFSFMKYSFIFFVREARQTLVKGRGDVPLEKKRERETQIKYERERKSESEENVEGG